jgi:hypothetical protein
MRLTGYETGLWYIDVALVPLELDHQGCDIIINLSVSCDLMGQPPVVGVSHCGLQYLKVATRASEHVLEPCQQGFNGGVGAGVSLGIEVNDVGLFIVPLCGTIP